MLYFNSFLKISQIQIGKERDHQLVVVNFKVFCDGNLDSKDFLENLISLRMFHLSDTIYMLSNIFSTSF